MGKKKSASVSKEAETETVEAAAAPETQASFWGRYFIIFLLLILCWTAVSRLYRLQVPPKFIFDEVYHSFTAELIVDGAKEVYDPWATPPEGVAYEWTHPPLSKLLMAVGIKIFGKNAFGWRISSVIFGVGVILLTALLALQLFNSYYIAILAAYLASIDGLVFVQSRIGLNDIHFTFFVLFTALFYVKWKQCGHRLLHLFLVGVGVGLTASVKWSAAYLCAIIGLDVILTHLHRVKLPRRNWFWWYGACFILVPALIYLGSYAHHFALGYGFEHFIELQRQMFGYHSNLKASHPYASLPHHWLLNLKPTWMHVEYIKDGSGRVGNIYNIGNHFILLAGLVAIPWVVYRWHKTRQWTLWFCLLLYGMMWVPWALSPRVSFFHHYTPAVPTLCILLSWALAGLKSDDKESRNVSYLTINLLILATLWFIALYPFLTAVPMPKWAQDLFYLLVNRPS